MPGRNIDALNWLEGRIASWVADPTSIGLTSAQATSLATDIINTRTAFTSVEAIRGESMNQTNIYNDAGDNMRTNASPLIANIKNFADNAPDSAAIYAAANVQPTSPRTPAAPPSQPSTLTAALNGNGSVTLNFEGTGPTGTVWQVWRQLASETAMSFVGNAESATKSFTDTTVPQGTASAQYEIQGVRGDRVGPASFAFLVKFGTAGVDAGEASEAA